MKTALTFDNLREQIQRLGERHGAKIEDSVLNQAISLVTQYEVALLTREQNEKEMKKRLRLLAGMELYAKSSQEVVEGFVERKAFTELAVKLSHSNLAKDLTSRNDLVAELLSSELTYYHDLLTIHEQYEKPFATNTKLPTKEIMSLFTRFPPILSLARETSLALKAGKLPGFVYLKKLDQFREAYMPYIYHMTTTLATYHHLVQTCVGFAMAVAKPLHLHGKVMSLQDLLMMPLQRITEYDTILKELHALTSWTISDNAALREVSMFFTTLNLEVTAEKERAQKTLRTLNIVSNLRIDATPSVDKKNKQKAKAEDERKRLGLQKLVEELPRYVREGPITVILDTGFKSGYLYIFSTVIITAEIHPETGELYFDNYYVLAGAHIKKGSERQLSVCCKYGQGLIFECFTQSEVESYEADLIQLLANMNKSTTCTEKVFLSTLKKKTMNVPPLIELPSPSFSRSLAVQKNITTLSDLFPSPNMRLPSMSKDEMTPVVSPRIQAVSSHLCHFDTILTHPAVNTTSCSNGLHVSSVQTMYKYKKRLLVVAVDGYGEKERSAKRSADLASKTLTKSLRTNQAAMTDVNSAATHMIHALAYAHEEILKSSLTNNISVMIGLFFKLSSKQHTYEEPIAGLNLASVPRSDNEARKSAKRTTPRSSKTNTIHSPATPAQSSSNTLTTDTLPSPALTDPDDRASRFIRKPHQTGMGGSPRTRPGRSMTEREPPQFCESITSSRRHSRRDTVSPRSSPRGKEPTSAAPTATDASVADGVRRSQSLSKIVVQREGGTNSEESAADKPSEEEKEKDKEREKSSPVRLPKRKDHPTHRKTPSTGGVPHAFSIPAPEEKWGLLQIVVGPYKTYVWNAKRQKVYELDAGRDPNEEMDQCGSLGRVFNADCPDLRDMKVTLNTCTSDEIVMVLPDHVTNSFDPESLGYTPRDIIPLLPSSIIRALPVSFPLSWEDLGISDSNLLKNQFKCTYVYNLLQQQYQQRQQQKHKAPMTPKVAVNTILSHCQTFYTKEYHEHDQHNGLCSLNTEGGCSLMSDNFATTTTNSGPESAGSLSLCRRGCMSVHLQQLKEKKRSLEVKDVKDDK